MRIDREITVEIFEIYHSVPYTYQHSVAVDYLTHIYDIFSEFIYSMFRRALPVCFVVLDICINALYFVCVVIIFVNFSSHARIFCVPLL